MLSRGLKKGLSNNINQNKTGFAFFVKDSVRISRHSECFYLAWLKVWVEIMEELILKQTKNEVITALAKLRNMETNRG